MFLFIFHYQVLLQAGVVPGLDMTPEAALSKLSYVLSLENLSTEEKRKMMRTNIRGEMSVLQKQEVPGQLQENRLIQAVADTLLLTSEEVCGRLGGLMGGGGGVEQPVCCKQMVIISGDNLCSSRDLCEKVCV